MGLFVHTLDVKKENFCLSEGLIEIRIKKTISVLLILQIILGLLGIYEVGYAKEPDTVIIEHNFENYQEGADFKDSNWDIKTYANDKITVETDEASGSKALKIEKGNTTDSMYAELKLPSIVEHGKIIIEFNARISSATKYFQSMGSIRNSEWSNILSPKIKQGGIFDGDSKWLFDYKSKAGYDYLTYKYTIDTDNSSINFEVYKDTVCIYSGQKDYNLSENNISYLNFSISTDNLFGVNAWDCIYEEGTKITSSQNPNGVMYIDNIKIMGEKPELLSANPVNGEYNVDLSKSIVLTFDEEMKADKSDIIILCNDEEVNSEDYTIISLDKSLVIDFLQKNSHGEKYSIVLLPSLKSANSVKWGQKFELNFYCENVISKCDFSEGVIPQAFDMQLTGDTIVSVDKDIKTNDNALKITKPKIEGSSRINYNFDIQNSGKIRAEFDFRFENNSAYFSDIGNFMSSMSARPAQICQKTDSLWKDMNTWLFIMEEPYEYFHVMQEFNFDTREYRYELTQNGKLLSDFYDINTDERFFNISSLIFSAANYDGVNGPDSGDGILWIDNIKIYKTGGKIIDTNAKGKLQAEQNSVYFDYDLRLSDENIDDYVEAYRNGNLLDKNFYNVTYTDISDKTDGYDAGYGRIKISFEKSKEYFNSEYKINIANGLKTIYNTFCAGETFEFSTSDYIGIDEVKLYDEFGRQLSHISDGAGKNVKVSFSVNDVQNKGYFAAAAIKDGEGKIVCMTSAVNESPCEETLTIPQNAGHDWYMELFIFNSLDEMTPYRKKQTLFKDKIIYVDENRENGNGTLEYPCNSIEKALSELSANTDKTIYTGAVVVLLNDNYTVTDTIKINNDLLEGFDLPVKITSIEENTQIGNIVELTRFYTAEESGEADRLKQQAAENVIYYELSEYGIDNIPALVPYGQNYSMPVSPVGVYYNENPMTLSRYPNSGYLSIKNVYDNGNFSSADENDPNNRGGRFLYSGADTDSWEKDDIWMFCYPRYDWQHLFIKLSSISDNEITTYHPSDGGFIYDQGFYFVNVFEELDSPGEYYIDREKNRLYIYPEGNIENSNVGICIYDKPILEVEGVKNITFEKISFSGTRNGIADVINCSNVDFNKCSMSLGGKYALNLNNVIDCDFANGEIAYMGGKGITVKSGSKKTMKAANNKIVNNKIHDFGMLETTYNPAVSLEGIGDYVAYNEIYNCDHMAISAYGNNNIYEYNDIHDVLRYSSDAGAVYTGRSWISGGNIFRYNYFHDLGKSLKELGNNAIYLDDLMYNAIIYGNVFENLETGVFVHGGRCNDIYSNIFINCENSVDIIHIYSTSSLATIKANAYVALMNKAFKDCFSELVDVIEDEPTEPKYNSVYNNAIISSGMVSLDETALPSAEVYSNEILAQELFEDGKYTDLSVIQRFIPNFIYIDFDNIGIR